MKRLAPFPVMLLVLGLALPACAQRHSAGGGGASHSAPAFHSSPGFRSAPAVRSAPSARPGYRAAAPNRYAAAPRAGGGANVHLPPGYEGGVRSHSADRNVVYADFGASRGNGGGREGHRRPYVSPYRARTAYGFTLWPAWTGPGYLAYPDASDCDDDPLSPQCAAGNALQPDDQGLPPYPAPYEPYPAPSSPAPSTTLEAAYTLVFNDGRPPETIHNYVLTQTTLYVGDGRREEIPLDELDLDATEKVNRDAGMDFRVPSMPGN